MSLPLLTSAAPDPAADDAGHISVWGSSGTGKTMLLVGICRQRLRDPVRAIHAIDVEGDVTPLCLEEAANPAAGVPNRVIHHLRPASPALAFALPILHVEKPDPLICCQTSVRALAIFQQVVGFGQDDYGPRLSKLFVLGVYGLSLMGRPLIDLPDLYAQQAAQFRAIVGDQFPYQFLGDEMRALDVLQPRSYLEYRDALVSRLMPIFSNPILRRVFGPQQPPLDIAAILRRRECVFLDLSGLEHRDSVLIGTAYVSLIFHHGLQRAPNVEPHTTLLIDEAFDYLTADLCRAFDRLRKRNIQLILSIQRIGAMR